MSSTAFTKIEPRGSHRYEELGLHDVRQVLLREATKDLVPADSAVGAADLTGSWSGRNTDHIVDGMSETCLSADTNQEVVFPALFHVNPDESSPNLTSVT